MISTVAYLAIARIVKPAETAVAKERLCEHNVSVGTVAHKTVEVPLGTVRSAPTATSPNYRVTARRNVFCLPQIPKGGGGGGTKNY
jgi:hypothetical protein